jgi:alcohol dehydrogenase class IV
VFTEAATRRKRPIVSHELLPDVAVLDPTLTLGLPPAAIAASGLDALAHAVESYVSKFANPLADVLAEKAAEMILEALPRTFREPENLDARLEMMEAALLAGWVQNQKVPGLGHAVAHQLGRFGVPHGLACGALLVPSIEVNQADEHARAGYRRLAQRIGLGDERELVARIDELRAALGADCRLREVIEGGLDRVLPQREAIRAGALEDACARANPRPVDATLIDEVLQRAL